MCMYDVLQLVRVAASPPSRASIDPISAPVSIIRIRVGFSDFIEESLWDIFL